MRWQRAGRMTAAALGLCTAAALYVSTRERAVVERPALPGTVDPVATYQSGEGIELRHVHDVERWRVAYGARRVYPDGRVVFDDVHILFKQDGTEVWADQATARGGTRGGSEPTSLVAEGHVRFRTGEGATVEGESLMYEEATEISRMPGPVSFTRGRTSGTGTGAVYERHADVFRILADAHVILASDEEDAARVDATAASLVFNSANRALLFEGNARIAHGHDLMTADAATLYLADDEQQFRVIELRGNARVMPGADPAAEAESADGEPGTPEMQARDIDLAFYPGTQALERAVLSQQARLVQAGVNGRLSIEGNVIHFSTAPDGVTLTSLEADDRVVVVIPPAGPAPAREIRAASLVATGNDTAGLTDALFSGGVDFTERVAATGGAQGSERHGTSRTLALDLAGQLDAIDTARFQQDVTFRDGRVSGLADLGTYGVASGILRLEPHPQRPVRLPHVTDGAMRVDAAGFIEVDLGTHDLHAEGDVKTQSRNADSGDSSRAAVFDGPEPVLGFGDRFWYARAERRVRYTGTESMTARLRQGESEVRADELTLDDRTHDLHATGRVESTLPIEETAEPGSSATPGLYRATAARMVYLDEARTLEYEGVPVTLEQPEGSTTAARIVLTLADAGRRLRRMVATSDPLNPLTADVRSRMTEGRQSLSDSLVYDAELDQYTLRGRPLVLRTHEEDGTCSEVRAAVGHLRRGSSQITGQTSTMGNLSCASPLTR